MQKKLISKSEFARFVGVNPSTVTRLCSTLLKRAVVGKRIDAAHPDAIKYLERQELVKSEPAATGLDPLYETAVKFCQNRNVYSINSLQREFKIGWERAKKLIDIMTVNGMISVVKPGKAAKTNNIKLNKPSVKIKQASKENEIVEIPEDIQSFLDYTLLELIEKFGTDTRFSDWLNATQKIENINEKRLKNAATKGKLISRELVRVGVIDEFNSVHLRLLKDGAKNIAGGVISKCSGGAEIAEIEMFISGILGSFIKPVKAKIIRNLKNV